MKITVFAAGSRGDIQPCIVLCQGLQQTGYAVALAAPADFAGFAAQHGVAFRPVRGDIQQIMASDTGRQFMATGGANPLKSIRAIRTLLEPVVVQMTDDACAACRDADAVISLGVLAAFAQTIAEARRVPLLLVEPAPLLPTRAFAAPAWPLQRNLGGWHNYLSGVVMLQVLWQWYRPFVNDLRRRLGLRAWGLTSFQRVLRTTPLAGAYSPSLIPRPADWPVTAQVTGCLFLDDVADWQPPADLAAFLAAGAAPVYIGFGSMAGRDPEQLTRVAIDALAQSGQRGVLATGWGGMAVAAVPDSVFVLAAAPHSWLFPRMAAVVHHGGAGTTAEGLRAGVPAVITPFAFDQFFWGAQLKRRGLGPAPLPQKQLTAARLAEAIHTAVTDAAMRQRARAFAACLRAEDGKAAAVAWVQRHLGAG